MKQKPEAVSKTIVSRVSAATGSFCAARAASNAGGHWQGAQQSRRASGAKPGWEAPLRAICFVARRFSGVTTVLSSRLASHPAKRASRPRLFLRPLLVTAILLFGALAATGCQQAPQEHGAKSADVEYLLMPGMEDLGLPFSSAVRVDNMLYLSGNLGNLPGTLDLAPGGIQGETRQTLDNIKAVAEQFGSSMDKVVKCTVFLADISEWGAMNEVYKTYFRNPPARSALGASGLALKARVEIECIATI